MASYFFDSSAAFKRYVLESGTLWVRSITLPAAANKIFLVRITGAEVVSALARQVPPLPQSLLNQALADFKHDFHREYQVLEVTADLILLAMALAEKYRLRGYDAVQLAAGSQLHAAALVKGFPAPVFVSADAQLNAAALAEALAVDDPNAYP